eukprot:g33194.t1
MSLHTMDGLVEAFEGSKKRAALGDKLLLLEIAQMDSFKPMQRYVDMYKTKAIKAPKDIGTICNLLFAEGISGVLINEFPVQVACASCWRTRSDLLSWYEAPGYQKELVPMRYAAARTLTLVVPMWEEKKETFEYTKRRGSDAHPGHHWVVQENSSSASVSDSAGETAQSYRDFMWELERGQRDAGIPVPREAQQAPEVKATPQSEPDADDDFQPEYGQSVGSKGHGRGKCTPCTRVLVRPGCEYGCQPTYCAQHHPEDLML